MIVQCPACSSRYRVNAEKLPAGGGNLKCPSCAHVFFLAPDGSTSEARKKSRSGGGETSQAPAPPSGETKAGGSIRVDELAQELINHLDEEGADWMSGWGGGGGGIADEGADARSTSGQVPAAGSGYDSSDFQAAGPRIEDEALARAMAEAATDESGDHEDDDTASAGEDAAASEEATTAPAERWKVKGHAGIVYDFPDVTALRRFIGSRESHEGIEVSRDGGESWSSVAEVPELSDVNPAIAKQRKPSPTQEAAAPARRKTGTRGKAAASKPPVVVMPPHSAEAKSTNRAWMWLLLLIILLGALATAHGVGIIDIPFLRGESGEAAIVVDELTPEQAERLGLPPAQRDRARGTAQADADRDDATRPQQPVRGLDGLYSEMLEEANRLASNGSWDDAIRLLHRARATMPNRADAWCAEVAVLERAERDAEAARELCTEARNAEAEGRPMDIPEGLVVVDDSITRPGEMVDVTDEEEEDEEDAPSPDGASADEP